MTRTQHQFALPVAQFDFVYFSSVDWNFTWQRPQQLASRLARFGKVLYINPLGLRTVTPKDWARILQRIVFRLAPRAHNTAIPNVTIHNPLGYLPFPNNSFANKINGWLQRRAIQHWLRQHAIRDPIVWVGVPSRAVLETIDNLPCKFLVYDCIDNFAYFHKTPMAITQAEQTLVNRAQVIFTTAHELYERIQRTNPQTFLLPNAADFDHFAATAHCAPPEEMTRIPQPIAGYFGEVAKWFDFDLVSDLATRNPNWSFVLIGQVQVERTDKLFALPNVYCLGRKPYADLPAYLNQFDVCLLPFQINALTTAVNPVKLYEYLAAGKPVVSTPLPEVARFRDVIEIADRAQFADALQRAFETRADKTRIEQRVAIARRNTWDQRVDEIVSILQKHHSTGREPHA